MRSAAALLGGLVLLFAAREAQAGTTPYRVAADGVTDSAITISWVTTTAETGHVVWGTSASSLGTTTHDSRGSSTTSTVHHVVLTGLSESTTYHWKIVSGATQYGDASGSAFQTTTGPSLVLVGSRVVAGKVLDAGGSAAAGALVRVTLRDADGSGSSGDSQTRTALTDGSGLWQFSLEAFRTTGLGSGFSVSATGDSILVAADGGSLGTVASTTDSGAASSSPTTITSSLAAPGIPSVTGVSPSQGTNTVATDLTVTGTDFLFATSGALADAAGTSLASFVVVSDTVVTGRVPAGVSSGSYAVRVTSSAGTSSGSSGTFTATVPPDVTDSSLPGATAGRPYSRTVGVSGGAAPLSWTVVTGSPPAGVALSTAGVLSGTPTSAGTSQFTVRVTDASGVTDDQQLTLVVAAALTTPAGTLPDWTRDRLYGSSEISTTGGTDPVDWTITGLPQGLTVSGSGRSRSVSGTPTSTGLHTIVATATDALGSTASRTWNLVIHDPPSVPSGTLPDWTRDVGYGTRTVTTAGGTDPVSWTVSGLPTGLTSSASGRTLSVSGTPTAAGSFSVTLTATDGAGAAASRTSTVVIHAPLTQPSGALPDWTAGRAYGSRTLTTTGGTDPVTWTFAGLPPGLDGAGSSRTATVTGTPTTPGDYTITATAADAAGASSSQTFDVTVNAAVTEPAGALPDWTVGRDYGSRSLSTTGGTDPVAWTVSGAPPGLDAAASGRTLTFTGTPTTDGTFTVTATATDAAGSSAARTATIVIRPPVATPTGSLPDWTVGRVYAARTFTVTGGTDPVVWSVAGLPAGLAASASGRTLTVSGTPTTSGTSSVTIDATDAAGSTARRTVDVTIHPPLTSPLGSLPDWTEGRDYGTRTLTTTGGTDPISWTSSGLPPGLSASANGRTFSVSGTPNGTGTFSVTVTATDASGASVTTNLLVRVAAPVSTPSGTLPAWTQGRDYGARTLTTTGGSDPVTWTTSGLPAGLVATPDGRTLAVSGTPTSAGTFTVVATAIDVAGSSAERSFTVVIAPPVTAPSGALPDWTIGRDYSAATLTTTGGTDAIAWSFSGLPTGLSASSSGRTATVTGRPTTVGSFSVRATVTDAAGSSATSDLTVVVNGALASPVGSLPSWTLQRDYGTRALSVAGGTAPLAWSVSGLPDGITGTPSGRDLRVTGTPTKEGTFVVLATATDAAGATSSTGWVVTIHAPLATPSGALPDWTAGRDYGTRRVSVAGGTDPVVWSFAGLPSGLAASVSGRTVDITGTPTVIGAHSVKLTATDATGGAAVLTADVSIHAPVRITTTDLGGWTIDRDFVRTLQCADGTPPYRWELISGGVPGLTFDAALAAYSGVPAMEGEFPVGFRVVDAAGSSAEREWTLTVHPTVALAEATLPFASVGRAYVSGVAWTGGTAPYTAAIVSSGSPAWLSVDAATGVLSGTPDAAGVHDVDVEVADVAGAKIVRTYRVEVAPVVPFDAEVPPEFAVPDGAPRVLLAFDALRASDVAFKFRRADRAKLPATVRLLRADGTEVPSKKPPKAVRTRAGLTVSLPETAATDRYFLSIDGLAGEAFTLVAQPKLRIETRFRGKVDIAAGAAATCTFAAPDGAAVVVRLERGRDVRFVRWTNVQTSASAPIDAPGPKLRMDDLAAWGDQVLEFDVPSGEAVRVRYEVSITPR